MSEPQDGCRVRVAELVDRILDGDLGCFNAELYGLLYRGGQTIVRAALTSEQDRDNVILDAITKFWVALDRGKFKRPASRACPFYLAIVRNEVKDLIRRIKRLRKLRGRVRSLERTLETELATATSPDPRVLDETPPPDHVMTREVEERLAGCLAGLPERLRAVVELHWYDRLSLGVVARLMDLSFGQIRTLHDRALKALQECLQRDEEK